MYRFYGHNVDFYAIIGIIVLFAFRVGHTTTVSSSVDTHTGNDVIVKGLRNHEPVFPWQLLYHQRPQDIKSG